MSILFVDYARQYEIDTFYEVRRFSLNVSKSTFFYYNDLYLYVAGVSAPQGLL